ncbi:MAG: TA system VapC family ribonuclease toxin [Gammaproteobacteria bacterium]
MIVPDANLLLYAYDSESTFFEPARAWWSACLNGTVPVGLCHAVVFAFVRISTNPRVYANPLSLATAAKHVETWYSRRITRTLLPDEMHHNSVLELLRAAGSAGANLVTDAQIAAIALAHRGEVHTADQDFRRFPNLTCRFPLQV